jgi:hypothetical protein
LNNVAATLGSSIILGLLLELWTVTAFEHLIEVFVRDGKDVNEVLQDEWFVLVLSQAELDLVASPPFQQCGFVECDLFI